MNKKKPAVIISACVAVGIAIVLLVMVGPGCPGEETPEPTLATLACTDQTQNSLTGRGEVKSIGAGPLSMRGFVYVRGQAGEPEVAVIPLENPSFESGDPPEGWSYRTMGQGAQERSSARAKVGIYSLKLTNGAGAEHYARQSFGADHGGRTLTLAVWAWCDEADKVRVRLGDYVEGWGLTSSSFHTGSGDWELLTVTRTIRPGATDTLIDVLVGTGDSLSAYFDGVVLVGTGTEGRMVYETGSFSKGAYSLTIEGLDPDTAYRIRAFGENEARLSYGNTVTCRTQAEQ